MLASVTVNYQVPEIDSPERFDMELLTPRNGDEALIHLMKQYDKYHYYWVAFPGKSCEL